VHAAIGLRNILAEWMRLRGLWLSILSWLVGFALLAAGLRAVAALVGNA